MLVKLRILGIDYDVAFMDSDLTGLANVNDAGKCYNTLTRIVISMDQSIAYQKCVLLHEIIEALDYRLELELRHNQITSLESGLFQVFRDNPGLIQLFLMDESNTK